mmetsp:Transcript_23638/g.66144  ORF Transcript_23638/g.66144 Transcript_23638/m.66144 type:complete len:298 (-) Transcript_23638:172-1065(-)
MHILVDVDAARGAAALAHVDEQADVASCGGLVQIRILAYDHGALTAKLQRHLLQIGLAGRLHDPVARGGTPGERHLADVGVPRDEISSRGAVAVDDVDDAGGEAGLLDQVAHQQARQRGLLAELHHRGAAHGQQGAELPGLHHQREVPGNDLAAHADRLVPRVCEGAAGAHGRSDDLATLADLIGPASIVPKAFDDESKVNVVGHVDRLAIVEGFHLSQSRPVLLDQVSQPQHHVATLGCVYVPPRLERRLGCRDGDVHILLPGLLHRRYLRLVHRVDGVEGLAGLGVDPLVVDEEL